MTSHRSVFGSRAHGLRLERMKSSSRFDGEVFRNTQAVKQGLKSGTVLPTLSEFVRGGQQRKPPSPLPVLNPLERWAQPIETGLRVTWLGHSTVLVEIDGARILTDPVWGDRASPVSFAGPKRFHPAPVPIASLPPLDAVIISHDHYDHLDHPTILAMAALDVPFITSLGVGAHLEAWGIPAHRIIELDWWEQTTLPRGGVTITAAPSQHFSGRSLGDRNRTAWSSFQVRGPEHAFFFSGDTGLTPEYTEIRERLGPSDLVMLEVGAFHPAWGDIHLGPENALAAHQLLGGGAFLPVHWGTFNLALHAWDEPPETLLRLARDVQLVMPRLGEPVEPARVERVEAWWRLGECAEAPAPAEQEATDAPDEAGEIDATVQWPID